jgi:hypothetical protein
MSSTLAAQQMTCFVAKEVKFLFWRHLLVAFLRAIVVLSTEEIYFFFSFHENKFPYQESYFLVTDQESKKNKPLFKRRKYLFFTKKTFFG